MFYVYTMAAIGAVVGTLAGILFLNWLERRMRRIKGTDGRATGDLCEAGLVGRVQHAHEESSSGGAMGFPFERRHGETVRIQPAGESLRVIWRTDDRTVASCLVDGMALAEDVFGACVARMGSGSERLEAAPEPGRDRVRFEWKSRRTRRRVLVLNGDDGLRVVDVVGRDVRGVIAVLDEAEGREFVGLLVRAVAAEEQRPASRRTEIVPMKHEPITGGQHDDGDRSQRDAVMARQPSQAVEIPDDWDAMFR